MTDPAVFLREFARDRAEQVVDTPGGFAALSPRRFPHSYAHNGLWVFEPVDPPAVIAAADDVLASFGHRRCEIGPPPDGLAAALTDAGYARGDLVIMTQRRSPDPDRPRASRVVTLDLEQRIAFAERVAAADTPGQDPAVRRELAGRARSSVTAADCTFLAVGGDDGVAQAGCDLFVRGDTAQIEEVVTLGEFRGRGHASRLVRAAAERARAEHGATTVFLVAETDDWPRQLYGRLGFDVTDTSTKWTRVLSAP